MICAGPDRWLLGWEVSSEGCPDIPPILVEIAVNWEVGGSGYPKYPATTTPAACAHPRGAASDEGPSGSIGHHIAPTRPLRAGPPRSQSHCPLDMFARLALSSWAYASGRGRSAASRVTNYVPMFIPFTSRMCSENTPRLVATDLSAASVMAAAFRAESGCSRRLFDRSAA